ncbi:MAG: hypothetical protein ACK4JB_19600 [Reyranella sp.]
MSYIVFAIVGLFSVVGAIVGWRRATEKIENPPGKYDFPGGMSRRDHLRLLARKHRQWRIPITLAYAIAGGAAAFALLMVYANFIRR